MSKLNLGLDIQDFDLERVGFSISVLDDSKSRHISESYLRMSLIELNMFVKALKAARAEIDVTTTEPNGVARAEAPSPEPRGRGASRAVAAEASGEGE